MNGKRSTTTLARTLIPVPIGGGSKRPRRIPRSTSWFGVKPLRVLKKTRATEGGVSLEDGKPVGWGREEVWLHFSMREIMADEV